MLLKVLSKNQNNTRLKITLGKEAKILGDGCNEQIFEIQGPGPCRFEVEEEASNNKNDKAMTAASIVLLPVYGVLNVIFQNAESEWIKGIRGYVLKANVLVDAAEDTDIELIYSPSVYLVDEERWAPPEMEVTGGIIEAMDIKANSWWEFRNHYLDYIRRMASVVLLAIALFAAMFCSGIAQGATLAAVTAALILAAITISFVVVAIRQYRKCAKLYNEFRNQSGA